MDSKTLMDKLPQVISCCFCCFLRAGTCMIAIVSFLTGLMFSLNVSPSNGLWNMEPILSNYNSLTDSCIQMTLGIISIFLCIISILLLVGALCNFPFLIVIYQWGVVLYTATVVIMFFILSTLCFFVHSNCSMAAGILCILIVVIILLTTYFLIVTNSLRLSLKFLASDEYKGTVA